MHVCAQLLQSRLTHATSWARVCQAPRSMRFSRQEYWNGASWRLLLLFSQTSNEKTCVCLSLRLHTHTQLYSHHRPPLTQLHFPSSGPGCTHHNGLTDSYTHEDEQAAALNIQRSCVSLSLEDQATSRKFEAEMCQGHSTAMTSGATVRRLQAGTTLSLVNADSRGELA